MTLIVYGVVLSGLTVVELIVTLSIVGELAVNVAVHVLAADIVTDVLPLVPLQSPLQLTNVEPALALAVTVTGVPPV
jgi:hypothetical protein